MPSLIGVVEKVAATFLRTELHLNWNIHFAVCLVCDLIELNIDMIINNIT